MKFNLTERAKKILGIRDGSEKIWKDFKEELDQTAMDKACALMAESIDATILAEMAAAGEKPEPAPLTGEEILETAMRMREKDARFPSIQIIPCDWMCDKVFYYKKHKKKRVEKKWKKRYGMMVKIYPWEKCIYTEGMLMCHPIVAEYLLNEFRGAGIVR